MAKPFHSTRLLYRAVEPDSDKDFILSILQDPISFSNSNAFLATPQSKPDAVKYIEYLQSAIIGVIICLPPTAPNDKPIPIGAIALKSVPAAMMHHRHTEMGIDIVKAYQGQGYGGEAISWILDWGFTTAGMHRIWCRHMGWNEGAGRLYQRLGFKVEGVSREELWYQGRWWDGVQLGILDREWAALRKGREERR